jgi:hypothetical protein
VKFAHQLDPFVTAIIIIETAETSHPIEAHRCSICFFRHFVLR